VLDITVLAPEDAGIAAVSALKAELTAALEKANAGSSILLDITQTKRADSSLAQLIVAFRSEAATKGCKAAVKGDEDNGALKTMLCCDTIGETAPVRQTSRSASNRLESDGGRP